MAARRGIRAALLAVSLVGTTVAGAAIGAATGGEAAPRDPAESSTGLPGFDHAVFLSHVNNPAVIPGFPGDPKFTLRTAFTVPKDGYYLQDVHEGEHTGTHYSAPCHFHTRALCANQLSPGDFILPAVVIDIRSQVRHNVDYQLTVDDLKRWIAVHGPMPHEAAVIAWTGCDAFWGPEAGAGVRSYYNCGTGRRGFHQPGFSESAVRWLIRKGILGRRGATATDTFGPDPGTDENFTETFLTLRRHRFTLENLTNLDQMPASGGWIVFGGPRNRAGSGAPSTVFGLTP